MMQEYEQTDGTIIRANPDKFSDTKVDMLERGIHEPQDRHLINTYVPNDTSMALDLGAGIGASTVALARKCDRVIAVEANEHLIPTLKETLRANAVAHKVDILHGAYCSRDTDQVEFYQSETMFPCSSIVEDHEVPDAEQVEVPAYSLEDLNERYGLRLGFALAADIEGAERMLLDEPDWAIEGIGYIVMEAHGRNEGEPPEDVNWFKGEWDHQFEETERILTHNLNVAFRNYREDLGYVGGGDR